MKLIKGLLGMKNNSKNTVVRSGVYCKCNNCKHEGYAYGVPTGVGVSSAFCSYCGLNNRLTPVENRGANVND